MMNTIHPALKLTALSAALVSLCTPVSAYESPSNPPESTVMVGVGNWSVDRPHEGVYDGMRDHDTYGLVDLDLNWRNDTTGTWVSLSTQNLGQDNREVRLEASRQGNIGGFLEFNRTPYNYPYAIRTGLQGFGTTFQTVSGTGAYAFPKDSQELGTTRNMIHAGFYKNLVPGLDLMIDIKDETKKGTQIFGGGGLGAYFLTAPIDSTIRQLETTLQFTGARLQLSGGYYGSWFDQDNGGMITARLNGAAPTNNYLSQPLGNQAHQGFLDGGFNFTPTTRGTFKVAYTHALQNEHLPIWDLTHAAGVPSSLNAEVNTTLVQLGLISRPTRNLNLSLQTRYLNQDDNTPAAHFRSDTTDPESYYIPESFKKTSSKAEATYHLTSLYSLTGGIEYTKQDRSIPEFGDPYIQYRKQLNETTYKLQLRRSMGETINGSIAYLRSNRKGSSILESDEGNPQNLTNPLSIADRKRDKLRGTVSWDPAEKLSLQAVAEYSKDSYGPDNHPSYGLTKGHAGLYSLDASYTFNETWSFEGWYSYEAVTSNQRNQTTSNVAGVNDIKLGEHTNALGVGLHGSVTPRFKIGLEVELTRSVCSYDENPALFSATVRPLPDIINRLTRYRLNGRYEIDKHASVGLELVHERWRTDDWTWQFADGTPFSYGGSGITDGTTITAPAKQNSTYVACQFTCTF